MWGALCKGYNTVPSKLGTLGILTPWAPTPPPQRQGFGRGPSAAIIASPRNVVIEPVPRVARVTSPASSQEVDELFEETTGAPPAAEGDEDTFKY